MPTADDETEVEYDVVVNHEEQYSIWRVGPTLPEGWRTEGMRGTKEHIETVWTDMRPLSVRRRRGDES